MKLTNSSQPPDDHSAKTPQSSGMTMVPVSMGVSSPVDSKEEGFKVNPQQLWSAFCRHWLLSMVLGVLAAVPVAYLAWQNVPTPYRAEAEIIIRSSRPRIGFELPEDRESFKVLKSGEMQRVKHPTTLRNALLDDKRSIAQTSVLKNIPNDITETQWLRNNLSVRSSGDETFTISLEGEDPQELALIANAVKDAYLGVQYDEMIESSSDRLEEINKQLKVLDDSVLEKQQAIMDLSAQAEGASSIQQDLQRESDLDKMSELQTEIRGIELRIIELKSQIDSLSILPDPSNVEPSEDGNPSSIVELNSEFEEELDRAIQFDPKYLELEGSIKQIERELERRKKLFNSEKLSKIKELIKTLEDLRKQQAELQDTLKREYRLNYKKSLNQAIGNDVDTEALHRKIQSQIQGLEVYRDRLIEELNQLEIKDEKKIEVGLNLALLRDVMEQDQKRSQQLRDQKTTLLIEKNAKPRIEENYPAEVPQHRETKKRDMLAAGGGLGAFGMIVALFTLLELRFLRVSSLRLLEDEFDFQILGTIPRLPVKVLQNQQNTRKSAAYKHTFTEAIDAARTVMLNQQKKSPLQIIMITSALGGEGKSTLSSHLAISFARAGKKTLLIDGDLRRPRVHDVFGVPDFPGFCEALRGETPVEKCIYDSGVAGLDVLPAGELDAYTLRLLAEEQTSEVLSRLRCEYDLVIFDTAPLLPVADSLLLMQFVDGVLLSIRKDHSRMSKVAAALKKIELVGGRVIGGIVIGIDEAEYGYRSSYYGTSLKTEPAVSAAE